MAIWFLLAFQAGLINAGGFICCQRFVSHTTGFATVLGDNLASSKWLAAVGAASVPTFFLLGTMVSAYFVDRRVAAGKTPLYSLLVGFIVVLMLIASLGGERGWFGSFGTATNAEPDYTLLWILCLACGIQNASITSASGALIRTTHLTGITTDLGIGLMRIFAKGQQQAVLEHERKATIMRMGIIIFFILGSTAGSLTFAHYQFAGFLIPVCISGGLLVIDLYERTVHGLIFRA